VWVADADGRNARQLTTFNGARGGTPTWSPDGQSIAFDLRGSDRRGDIFVASVRGGAAARVTTDPADDIVPAWSHDGRWIYFESTRRGRAEMWKMPARGGDPVQITHGGAISGKESVDGRYLYYSRLQNGLRSLRRIGASGGEDVEILPRIAYWANFAVVKDGVYYEAPPPDGELGLRSLFAPLSRGATIEFLSFAPGGKITTVLKLTQYAGHGLDVSPDGRTLLFGQMDGFSEDLLLVENVR
jgi:dipeptidyl aminopeptidase/acylaminoacyl peptidase